MPFRKYGKKTLDVGIKNSYTVQFRQKECLGAKHSCEKRAILLLTVAVKSRAVLSLIRITVAGNKRTFFLSQ